MTLHSRLRYGLTRYRREAPDADVLVFEPKPEDLPRFMTNIMRTSGRIRIAEYAYRSTMALLDSDSGTGRSALLESLAEMRRIIEEHQQADTSVIFEEA